MFSRNAPLYAALVITLLVPPERADAAACCMSASAVGTGRLLVWEEFAVALRTTVAGGLGHWNPQGKWTSKADDYQDVEWRTLFWGMAALSPKLAVYGSLPWATIYKTSGSLSDTSTDLGDASLGLRYEIFSIGEYAKVPGVAFSLGVVAPTGRATHESTSILGTDVTGRGAWALSAGLSVEYTRVPWFVRTDVGVTVPLPAERDDIQATQHFGPRVDTTFAGGYQLMSGVVMSTFIRLGWEDTLSIDGKSVANSGKLDMGVGAALSWRFKDHWTIQTAIDSGLFADELGANIPGRTTGTLGVRYGYF